MLLSPFPPHEQQYVSKWPPRSFKGKYNSDCDSSVAYYYCKSVRFPIEANKIKKSRWQVYFHVKRIRMINFYCIYID